MGKRILAWVLLVGFVLLIVNILTFQFLLGPCTFVYIIIIVWFIFTNKPLSSKKDKSIETKESDTK